MKLNKITLLKNKAYKKATLIAVENILKRKPKVGIVLDISKRYVLVPGIKKPSKTTSARTNSYNENQSTYTEFSFCCFGLHKYFGTIFHIDNVLSLVTVCTTA